MYNNEKFRHVTKYLILFFLSGIASAVNAEHPVSLSELVVSGEYSGFDTYVLNPDLVNVSAADSAQLLKKVPVPT